MSISKEFKLGKETRYILQGAIKVHGMSLPFFSADWRDLKTLEEPVLNGENMKEFREGKYKYFRVIITDDNIIHKE